ncbi:MAG: hypothetical protein CMI16_12125 [Opitutaceae bacterium]|nr:hypothetical protein [Opitutaceae bacterium]|tara:strand:+ start:973 stop:1932 length:960 start_codon:yes stop_codon:yes gene_type:complete
MKLLKIFGIVAGIHAFALVLIFANPGCSASSKATSDSDTLANADSSAVVSVPQLGPSYTNLPPSGDRASTQLNAFGGDSPVMASPIAFNPDAAAVSGDDRYRPTRPHTTVATALKAEPVTDVVPVSTYTVARGDSLWSIAKRNNLTVSELAEANNLRASSMLKVDQKLIIPGQAITNNPSYGPAIPTSTVAPKQALTPAAKKLLHVVASGQTLGGIARKYDVSVGSIATANNISDPAKIRPGQELIIPGWKQPEPKKAAAIKPVPKRSAPVAVTQSQPAVIQTDDSPVLFSAPPADKPLDQGFESDAGEAPMILIEEAN